MSRRNKARVLLLPALVITAGCSINPGHSGQSEPVAGTADPRIRTTMEAGDFAKALPMLEQHVATSPEDVGAKVNLAIAYRETGQLDRALDVLEKAVAQDPNQAAAQDQLGIVCRQLGQFDRALEAYKKAIRIDEHYALAHRNLGILYDIYLQQPSAALTEYERYVELTGQPDAEVNGWVTDLKRRTTAAQARAK